MSGAVAVVAMFFVVASWFAPDENFMEFGMLLLVLSYCIGIDHRLREMEKNEP